MHFTPSPQSNQSKHDVYYEGNKKNEMNDLKKYFKTVLSNPDMEIYRKQVIKRIILYTTQGVDTSRFNPEMVIASGTKDLVEKKLVFFYLSIHSNQNVDFARMAINTFSKDTMSPNPSIRALSIRHLSNLRFKGRQEYVMPILKKGLQDFSPIVRKACLMGITKLITQQNRNTTQPIRDQELLNKLYEMLRDSDSNVVAITMQAINEIQPQGIAMSRKLTHYLMENLQTFGEMQLATVLSYIQLYDPKSQQEAMDFLNKLQPRIRTQNLSLLLAIIKIYLKYGEMYTNLLQQIHLKIKQHLLTFVFCSSNEISFVALKHILYMIKKYNLTIYTDEVKKFYLLQNDPTYIKALKLQLMHLNCNENNFGDIINQFTEYIRDQSILDQVMQSFNYLIMRLNITCAKQIIKTLNDIVVNTSDCSKICNSAIKVIRTFLRKYPEEFPIFEHTFYIYAKGVSSTASRCAMIEIIGDFGQFIEDAVQLIVWSQNKIQDELKISLLRANVKMFFKRPVEMMNIVGNLFREVLLDDQTRMPVKDYASMLYRGLQNDIEGFKKQFLSIRPASEVIPLQCPELNFNTLETIYMKGCSSWLISRNKYIELLEQIDYDSNIVDDPEQIIMSESERLQLNRSMVDLGNSQQKKIQVQDIDQQYQMTAQEFQMYWQQYQIGSSITRMVKQAQLLTQETLEELFKLWGVTLLASMESQESIKQYYYCKLNTNGGQKICAQVTIMKQVETCAIIVKSEDEELAGFFAKYVEEFMKINQIL